MNVYLDNKKEHKKKSITNLTELYDKDLNLITVFIILKNK